MDDADGVFFRFAVLCLEDDRERDDGDLKAIDPDIRPITAPVWDALSRVDLLRHLSTVAPDDPWAEFPDFESRLGRAVVSLAGAFVKSGEAMRQAGPILAASNGSKNAHRRAHARVKKAMLLVVGVFLSAAKGKPFSEAVRELWPALRDHWKTLPNDMDELREGMLIEASRANAARPQGGPHGGNGDGDDPPKEPPKLSRRAKLAYLSWKIAERALADEGAGGIPTDRQAHNWLQENGAKGYPLPDFDTWHRYVREGRAHYADQKNTPRAGRLGGSIAPADSLD